MYYKRNILKSIITSTKEYPVTLITGARQVGKSTLVTYFEKKGYKYLTFDDTDLLKEAKKDPKGFIKKHGYPIILDEIQRAKELFVEIEYIVNKVRREQGSNAANGMYILTGSQKFQLMMEISESLAGRVGIIEMEPLSQAEIRGWKEDIFTCNPEKLINRCQERVLSNESLYFSIVRGFYPARWEYKDKPITNFYRNYMKTYIDRDVSLLINLKDLNRFENFMKAVAACTGQEFNANKISKIVGIDNKTVNNWLSVLITSNIVTLLEPYNEYSINKRIVKSKKIYFNDTGLACYLIGIDTYRSFMLSTFKGQLVETYVHNEIRKSLRNNNVEFQMFFYRDNNQNEIDFILLIDGYLHLVEVKSGKHYSSNDIKGFKQLINTKYNIAGQCLICSDDNYYRINSQTWAFPIKCV